MKSDYQAWINAHVMPDPTGTCREVTAEMAEAFPELRRVRGHYVGAGLDKPWSHWWLVAEGGTIIDPTAAQWPDGGRGLYEPHDETKPEPTGKCPNCGGYCYHGDFCCSDTCSREYVAYVTEAARQ